MAAPAISCASRRASSCFRPRRPTRPAARSGRRGPCPPSIPARQVGASGSLVEPRCYLAFGIAGATQHLQGITRCERVLAINTDLHADMVKRADLAVIADAQVVMPALTKLARERLKGGRDAS